MSAKLPMGDVRSIAFLESSSTLALVIEEGPKGGRLFLRNGATVIEAACDEGVFFAIAAARGYPKLLALVRGKPRRRATEPLILDELSTWLVDPVTGLSQPLSTDTQQAVVKLLGPADLDCELLCVCSDSHRTATTVVVNYHIARLSLESGSVTVLERDIGPRW